MVNRIDMVNEVNKRFTEIKEKYLKAGIIKRFISAIILLPLFLISLYSGGVLYSTVIIIMGMIVAYEFFTIIYKAKTEIIRNKQKYKWYFFGAFYSLITIVAMLFLRNQNEIASVFKYKMMLWICLIVWTTDIAAYFIGIAVGGPKILPKVSPNKTWSGLVGALLLSVLIHEIAVRTIVNDLFNTKISKSITWSIVILTSLVSQAGDFLESVFKRRFRVKNSGDIIPGHGGMMDRIDGLSIACIIWFVIFSVSLILNYYY